MSSLDSLRDKLATAHRWAAEFGFSEGIDTHLSVRASAETMLVTPFGVHWSAMQPDYLIEARFDGSVISGAYELERSAACIHGAIYLRHSDTGAVLHSHMLHATAIACIEGGTVEMIHQNSARFADRIHYDRAYSGVAFPQEEGERIAEAVSQAPIVFLQNHGVIVTGSGIEVAFDDLYYLDRACRLQAIAAGLGSPAIVLQDETLAKTAEQIESVRERNAFAHFRALQDVSALREVGRAPTSDRILAHGDD
ncbi:class II aldolase/adducin family protein [Parasphingopyxis sp.]|uniref:class II aldolase/adducin family protein n=1 Tax=Parasphingopyxis sp. TaxID=1920299 RepID=UPI002627EC8B|nr:class II aldolase/adducin family protein [Parasphingopyxis sp.]